MVNKLLKKAVFLLAATTAFTAQAADVETLPSGVRIEHVMHGVGVKPTADSTVTVQYRGTLVATGAEFDSVYGSGTQISFGLRKVIPCWTEAMQHIAVGGVATVICPAHTAYGARGVGSRIPPDSDLRFDVAMLNVR